MVGFVADASATLPWCFEDEATSWSETLLDRVCEGELLFVPAHWIVECDERDAYGRTQSPPSVS
jgi:hypothetical protein